MQRELSLIKRNELGILKLSIGRLNFSEDEINSIKLNIPSLGKVGLGILLKLSKIGVNLVVLRSNMEIGLH